jgi:MFS family permease
MVDLALIAFINIIVVKIILSFLLGLIVSGIYPILFSILLSRDPSIKGSIYSFLGFVGYGTFMLYQLASGYVAEFFGKEMIIFISLASGVLCFVFTVLLVRYRKILS